MLMNTITIYLPQGGGTEYNIPADTVPDLHDNRLATRITNLHATQNTATEADAAWRKAGTPRSGKAWDAQQQAYQNLHVELVDTLDYAAATSAAAEQHAIEQYKLAAIRFERARAQALEALHAAAVHANRLGTIRANPATLGLDRSSRNPLFGHAAALAGSLEALKLRGVED